ncbi:MAG TPA: lysophospholipid acyltransferase family protein [Thermoanaerobaculia bacterium]|nr:lysophospholipid acyltransferase family protein [Thermoanaerobaculia bacterium]
MRSAADRFVVVATRFLVSIFFRRVEIVGEGRLPRQGPVIVVANHVNSLVDPLLLITASPRPLRFLAKSTLFDNPLLRPLLKLAAVIPVFRRMDTGVDTAKNLETFARCHELLEAGGVIALFPEGISHNEPALAPLKTGAARIALEAEGRFGPLGVRIVPVGLTFDAKGEFRSRALVEVGEPIDPSPELEQARTDQVAAVRALTARIERGLAAVTLNYSSWREAALIGQAADVFARPALEVPGRRSLAEDFDLQRALIEGYLGLANRHPEAVREAADAVARYGRLLKAARLRDDQVASSYSVPSVARYLARKLAVLLPLAPFALVGAVLSYLPYRLAGVCSRWLGRQPDLAATYKLFPSLVLFPLTWGLEAWAAARWLGPGWALVTLVAVPLLGRLALAFEDRRRSLFRETRAYLLLATREGAARELAARREAARQAVERLAGLATT